MRYLSGSIVLSILLSACSATEVAIDEPAFIEEEETIPAWFHRSITSSSDSVQFSGYSMATAADSVEAIALGRESAEANLRFEIDQFTERTRSDLASQGSGVHYQTTSFIKQLRNGVQSLDFTGVHHERTFKERSDGIFQVYTQATLNREDLYLLFSDQVKDELFLKAIQESKE